MTNASTSSASTSSNRIADALVVVSCAYTSLETGARFGLLDREQTLYRRLWPRFRTVVFVSYGDDRDHSVAAGLVPSMLGHVWCVCNDRKMEPATFLASVPDRVCQLLAGHSSALVLTEQHWGGDVALCISKALRAAKVHTGLCARTGYHWSWTMAREHGPASAQFAQACFLERELVHGADTVIATTPTIADTLAFQHQVAPDRFRVVPNYVLTDHSPAPLSARAPEVILTAGRLAREKRVDLLIRAVLALPEPERSRVRLLVVGLGPEEHALRNLASALQRTDEECSCVEFRPRVPHRELLELMRSCRIYAQCSEYEGHPKTVLEAMAAGSAVIVTDAPGLADRVQHGATGLVCAPEVPALTSAIHRLLTDDHLAARLGTAAAGEVRDTLGFEAVFPRYEAACVEAMSIAGRLASSVAPPVIRWDQPLLKLAPDAAAATWFASMHAYAKRLEPPARDVFAQAMLSRLGGLDPVGSRR